MSGLDLTRLTPADGAVTLRSFDRRFRSTATPVDDPDVEAWCQVPGPDGHSAVEHVAAAGRALTVLHHALRRILGSDEPYLDEAVLDRSARDWLLAPAELDAELDALADIAAALADLVDDTPADDWNRAGRVPGPTTIEAIDVLREAVDTGMTHLRAAEQAMSAARRD